MDTRQRLTDYRIQYEDSLHALDRSRETLRKFEQELKECEQRGEIAPESLMQDLRSAEAWVDWFEHECEELRIQVEECEAMLADDDE